MCKNERKEETRSDQKEAQEARSDPSAGQMSRTDWMCIGAFILIAVFLTLVGVAIKDAMTATRNGQATNEVLDLTRKELGSIHEDLSSTLQTATEESRDLAQQEFESIRNEVRAALPATRADVEAQRRKIEGLREILERHEYVVEFDTAEGSRNFSRKRAAHLRGSIAAAEERLAGLEARVDSTPELLERISQIEESGAATRAQITELTELVKGVAEGQKGTSESLETLRGELGLHADQLNQIRKELKTPAPKETPEPAPQQGAQSSTTEAVGSTAQRSASEVEEPHMRVVKYYFENGRSQPVNIETVRFNREKDRFAYGHLNGDRWVWVGMPYLHTADGPRYMNWGEYDRGRFPGHTFAYDWINKVWWHVDDRSNWHRSQTVKFKTLEEAKQ
ncbi:MAG: hypothetical protein WD049_10460 [Candidatus Paceibacterota bacterium]